MMDIMYSHPEVTKIINNECLTEEERILILENMSKEDHHKYSSNHTRYNDLEFLIKKTIDYKSKHPSDHPVILISIDLVGSEGFYGVYKVKFSDSDQIYYF